MQSIRTIGQMMVCALVAGGAGGLGGSVAHSFWSWSVIVARDGATLYGMLLSLFIALSAGFFLGMFGAAFGLVVGFAPSLITGFILIQFARWRLFQSGIVWALVGALAGLAAGIAFPWEGAFSSRAAWVGGGASAMITFWALGHRAFRLGQRSAAV